MEEVAEVVNGTISKENGDEVDNNPLLFEIDSYMDELQERLIVSRMVSDSVTKGIVSGIQQEAAEQVRLNCDGGCSTAFSFVKSLQDEFETGFSEQQSAIERLSKKWRKRVDDIYSVRRDLSEFFESFLSSDLGMLGSSHRTPEIKGHNGILTIGDVNDEKLEDFEKPISEQLISMEKEKLIAYFRKEMNEMKRQHDVALQEKTEELFILKRNLLKEKGSSPLHFRKEKDFEVMKKKMNELVLKLDGILMDNKKLPIVVDGNRDLSKRLNERIETFFSENHRHNGLRIDVQREASYLALKVSAEERNMLEEIERLQLAFEELKVEATVREEKYKGVIKELLDEIESEREDLETMTAKVIDDNYCAVLRGAIGDAHANINSIVAKIYEEKASTSIELAEKNKKLCLEIGENGRLIQEISLLLTRLEEKEMMGFVFGSQLVEQKEHFELMCQERNIFRDQVHKQEIIIASLKNERDMLKGKFDETIEKMHWNEVEVSNLNKSLNIATNNLLEMKLLNDSLQRNLQEKQEELVIANTTEREQKSHLESIVVSMTELTNALGDCRCNMIQKMHENESRLELLSHQSNHLKEQANQLNRRVLWYRDRFEARCEDLRKAEKEVDLLADEVDTLLDLLQKIHMALDHYSPVLQHYPGVVEILKLINREVKGVNAI